jgi:hypothetical protein
MRRCWRGGWVQNGSPPVGLQPLLVLEARESHAASVGEGLARAAPKKLGQRPIRKGETESTTITHADGLVMR